MRKYAYGGFSEKYDMSGVITMGTGTFCVHDIFDETPDFMKRADVIFTDPPGTMGLLNGFYAKAEKEVRTGDYGAFLRRLFEVIAEIDPKFVYVEAFRFNLDAIEQEIRARYPFVEISTNTYYRKAANRCWIVAGGKVELPYVRIDGLDEEAAIERICADVDYRCIGDPCMGKGLVGYYANLAGKPFVGTELNKNRLAVLCDRLEHGRGRIN